MGVTFNGTSKLIICSAGTTRINVKSDVYSTWKEWLVIGNNSKYLPALSAIGGDPITDVQYLGSTFFLENGWKIRPCESSHTLTVEGNLYTRDGSSPIVSTLGNYNVMVNMSRSNLIDTVSTSGGSGTGITTSDIEDIVQAVWAKTISGVTVTSMIEQLEILPSMEEKMDSALELLVATEQKVDDNQALIIMSANV